MKNTKEQQILCGNLAPFDSGTIHGLHTSLNYNSPQANMCCGRSTGLCVWPDTRMSTPSLPANFTRELSSPQDFKNGSWRFKDLWQIVAITMAKMGTPRYNLMSVDNTDFELAHIRDLTEPDRALNFSASHAANEANEFKAVAHVSGKLKSWSASPQTIWQSWRAQQKVTFPFLWKAGESTQFMKSSPAMVRNCSATDWAPTLGSCREILVRVSRGD